MSSPPSARPPSSQRRTPDLDSPQAREFVDRAATRPSIISDTRSTGDGVEMPTRALQRREQVRPLTLRIPDSLHTSLLYIAENGSKSMNQFVIDVLTPAVDAQLEKIAKRKTLGLD